MMKLFKAELKKWEWNPNHPECEIHMDSECHYSCQDPFYNIDPLKEWMLRTMTNNNTEGSVSKNNLERLLEEVTPKKYNFSDPKSIYEKGDYCCIIVFIILLRMKHGNLIYIFQKAGVFDKHLETQTYTDTRSYNYQKLTNALRNYETESSHIEEKERWNYEDITRGFERQKWFFLTPSLTYEMRPEFPIKIRLPFCRRRRVSYGNTAEVFEVVVPENFVAKELRELLGEASEMDQYRKCYMLAVKSYPLHRRRVFDMEVLAFQGLIKQPGVVRYFGSYSHGNTNHILLELGHMDLWMYFTTKEPPDSAPGILKFWKSMFKIAEAIYQLHKLTYLNQDYDGWHGDVKPANIVVVGPEFKLADFGYAKFEERAKNEPEPRVKIENGSTTYGAPEFARAIREGGESSQKIDTWAFGCVLSVAATWIIRGSRGVQTYTSLRCEVNAEKDTFHDGDMVLKEIKEWHDDLRKVRRMSDYLTPYILDVIDNHLLQPENTRSNSEELYDRLNSILSSYPIVARDTGPAVASSEEANRKPSQRTKNIPEQRNCTTASSANLQPSSGANPVNIRELEGTPVTSTNGPPASQITQPRQGPLDKYPTIWDVVRSKGVNIAPGTFNFLLEKDPEVAKCTDDDGYTPIMIAANENNIPAMRMLLRHSHLLQKGEEDLEGKTVLHYAIMGCPKTESQDFLRVIGEIIKESLEKSPDSLKLVNIHDVKRRSPLYLCIGKNMVETARLLIKNGAWITPPADIPYARDLFREAADKGQHEIVDMILKEKPDLIKDMDMAYLEKFKSPRLPRIEELLEEKKPTKKPRKFFGRAKSGEKS